MTIEIPDIANTKTELPAKLNKAGMSEIEVPVRLEVPNFGKYFTMGYADAYVSLDDHTSKGIHMSRLFIALQNTLESKPANFKSIKNILEEFTLSHKDSSHSAFVNLRFQYPVRQKALLSENYGWRSYPCELIGHKNGAEVSLELKFEVSYSSTCPCSAALARQLIQKKFASTFTGATVSREEAIEWLGTSEGILATPHGQRSKLFVHVKLASDTDDIEIPALIKKIETTLKTPVQAAVKREDEQEFARLNGQNLMFAEDAARRGRQALLDIPGIDDFEVRAVHYESLHPHNAEAVASKAYE